MWTTLWLQKLKFHLEGTYKMSFFCRLLTKFTIYLPWIKKKMKKTIVSVNHLCLSVSTYTHAYDFYHYEWTAFVVQNKSLLLSKRFQFFAQICYNKKIFTGTFFRTSLMTCNSLRVPMFVETFWCILISIKSCNSFSRNKTFG